MNVDDAKTRQLIGWVAEGVAEMADRSLLPGDGPWQVLIASAGGWGTTDRDGALLRFAVRNVIRELLPGESFEYGQSIVLIQPASLSDHDSAQRRQAVRRLEELLGCRIILVGGVPVIRPELLHRSFLTARDALAYRQQAQGSIREYADIAERTGGKSICSAEEEKQLTRLLQGNKHDELKQWTGQYVRGLMQDPETTPRTLRAALQSAAMAAFRWMERMARAGGGADPEPRYPAYHPPEGEEHEHIEALYGCLAAVMESHHRHGPDGGRSRVAKAKAYILENLGAKLSLQQVAAHVQLHPNHLSELFRRETGMRFVDYVIGEKMRKAAEELATPAKVSDIAASLGYGDVKSFSKRFKKHTGMTPGEYRERLNRALAEAPDRDTMNGT